MRDGPRRRPVDLVSRARGPERDVAHPAASRMTRNRSERGRPVVAPTERIEAVGARRPSSTGGGAKSEGKK